MSSMKEIFGYFNNIKGGPVSTFIGLAMFIAGGIMIWKTEGLTWASIEVGVFILGSLLLLKSDAWLKSVFGKKKE